MSDLEKRIRAMIESAESCALYDLAGIHYELMEQEKASDAERASLLARVEQAERERDVAIAERDAAFERADRYAKESDSRVSAAYEEASDRYVAHVEAVEADRREMRAERDAWKARAGARLDVSPEDAAIAACRLVLEPPDGPSAREADARSVALNVLFALRDHARKAVTG